MDQFSPATWDDLTSDRLLPRRRRNRDAQNEIRKRVATLKAESGCDRFPTDVRALARTIGIQEVRLLPLSMRGRIVRESFGIVAELNQLLSWREQRFVLAHEIAHILLARDLTNAGPESIFGSTRAKNSYSYVERLCDFAAREILIPENAIRKELKSRPFSLDFAVTLAAEADCDVEVVAECICDLPGWRELLFLFCRRNAESLEVNCAVPNSSTAFEVVYDADSLLRRAERSSKTARGTQDLWANGNRTTADAEARWLDSKNAVLLIGSRSHQ